MSDFHGFSEKLRFFRFDLLMVLSVDYTLRTSQLESMVKSGLRLLLTMFSGQLVLGEAWTQAPPSLWDPSTNVDGILLETTSTSVDLAHILM